MAKVCRLLITLKDNITELIKSNYKFFDSLFFQPLRNWSFQKLKSKVINSILTNFTKPNQLHN
jgi:hypothetical protein